MSGLVELVARAIDAVELAWKAENGGDDASVVDCPGDVKARAAIEALREPSDQMIDAVYKNEFIQAMRPEDLYAAWESMIDTALGEKP